MKSSQEATNDHDEVDSIGSSSNTSSRKKANVTEMFNMQRKAKEDVVAKFFFANKMSFNATHSPLYKEMVRKVIATGNLFSDLVTIK